MKKCFEAESEESKESPSLYNPKKKWQQSYAEKMRNDEIKIPYVPTKKLEDTDLTSELNIEKYELMKTSHLRFSHPEGSHDDVFWCIALAVYASVQAPLPGKGAIMGY